MGPPILVSWRYVLGPMTRRFCLVEAEWGKELISFGNALYVEFVEFGCGWGNW